jgi:hypothetical protein
MAMRIGPTPRECGFMIGRGVELSGVHRMADAFPSNALSVAGVTKERLANEYLLLAVAATLNAIEAAGLRPGDRSAVTEGLFDWCGRQPATTGQFLVENIRRAAEGYAAAAADEKANPKNVGEFTELELEFLDRLLALGEDSEHRARACAQLAAVAPAHLWPVHQGSATQCLADSGLVFSAA